MTIHEEPVYQPPRLPRNIPHLQPPESRRRSNWNDRHEMRVSNWLEPWDFDSPLDVGLISVPSSKTAIRHNGSSGAPNALREALVTNTTYSPDFDVDLATMRVREIGEVIPPLIDPRTAIDDIQEAIQACLSQPERFFPVIIGGDHAITAPSVRAYCATYPDQRVGLIQFDAHNDVRVMEHGPTNGTPIRGILQSGIRVAGQNLVQVGIHGFMNSSYYKRWVEGQGGTIISGRQCRKRGMEDVVRQAVQIASRDTDAIYVTVDMDVLESSYAVGTGAPSPEGIHPTDLCEALFALGQVPKVAAIDFVEHDPTRDIAQTTSRTLASSLLTFLAGLFLRLNNDWRGYDDLPILE